MLKKAQPASWIPTPASSAKHSSMQDLGIAFRSPAQIHSQIGVPFDADLEVVADEEEHGAAPPRDTTQEEPKRLRLTKRGALPEAAAAAHDDMDADLADF